jgi:hypothetical protein
MPTKQTAADAIIRVDSDGTGGPGVFNALGDPHITHCHHFDANGRQPDSWVLCYLGSDGEPQMHNLDIEDKTAVAEALEAAQRHLRGIASV